MNDNADGGMGSAPSATAARSSLPASKDYPRPRLRQTSPLRCTSSRSFQYPVWLGSTVRALCPACEDACTHTHEIGHTHTHRQQRAHAHTHTRTNPHSHAGRVGHSRMRRWVRRHRGDESKGYQRREHQSDDHRPAANAEQRSGLIQPPCDSFEWHQESGGFRWAAVGDANSSTHGDTHTKYEYVGM